MIQKIKPVVYQHDIWINHSIWIVADFLDDLTQWFPLDLVVGEAGQTPNQQSHQPTDNLLGYKCSHTENTSNIHLACLAAEHSAHMWIAMLLFRHKIKYLLLLDIHVGKGMSMKSINTIYYEYQDTFRLYFRIPLTWIYIAVKYVGLY